MQLFKRSKPFAFSNEQCSICFKAITGTRAQLKIVVTSLIDHTRGSRPFLWAGTPESATSLGCTSLVKIRSEHLPKVLHLAITIHSFKDLVRVLAQLFDTPALSLLKLIGYEVTSPLEIFVNILVEMKTPMLQCMPSSRIAFAESADEEEMISANNLQPVRVVLRLIRCLAFLLTVAVRIFIITCDFFQSVVVVGLSVESDFEGALVAGAIASIALENLISVSTWGTFDCALGQAMWGLA